MVKHGQRRVRVGGLGQIGSRLAEPAFTTSTCSAKPRPDHTSTDQQKPILVNSLHPTFHIILNSNRTTGYSWYLLSMDPHFVQPVSAIFQPPQNKELVGAPGKVNWTFKMKATAFKVPLVTNIVLIYARPWDLSQAERRVVTVITSRVAN